MAVRQAFAAPVTKPAEQNKNNSSPASEQEYPFRDAYAWTQGEPSVHALLSVANTHVHQSANARQDDDFTVDIRLYNDSGWHKFYNVYWNRLIPLPGCLALYDAHKRYVCDLMESMGGSRRMIQTEDWTAIQSSGYAGTSVSVSLPYPTYLRVPAGTYYLQVIYFPCAIERPTNDLKFFTSGRKELFRSNAVKITVVN